MILRFPRSHATQFAWTNISGYSLRCAIPFTLPRSQQLCDQVTVKFITANFKHQPNGSLQVLSFLLLFLHKPTSKSITKIDAEVFLLVYVLTRLRHSSHFNSVTPSIIIFYWTLLIVGRSMCVVFLGTGQPYFNTDDPVFHSGGWTRTWKTPAI